MEKYLSTENLERHSLGVKVIRIFTVPLLNNLPASLVQKMMKKSSKDASAVVERGGSTHALEAMYSRHSRSIFSRGFWQGLADSFWHHVISQPKAIRNRLKIVELAIEKELVKIISEKSVDTDPVRILNVGGGSSRAIMHVLNRIFQDHPNVQIKVTNIDKDARAIELGKKIAEQQKLGHCFEWINDDARNISKLVSPESFDLVEMVGLLDYFQNDRGTQVIGQIYNALKVGGMFIVANVFPNSEMPFVYKTGWPKMYYKTPEDIRTILKQSGFNAEPDIFTEPLKVHIIGVVRK
ncbi:MAG: class I SAM-dependent methyltransferase [Candidatus Paceibacterota bacterium]|jgi:ubiquinone/menaquinone biosynthesis C-methylase UbiE